MPPCPHFDLKIVQRSKRQSAVAAAAYQSGERLFSEYDQKQKYYSHKSEIVHTEIMLPPHAPPEYADRNTLWNAAEALASMQDGLEAMEIPELLLLVMETSLVSLCMKIMSVLITVILYGRMIEIYLYCSVSPIPFATMTNREWGQIGNNYLKGLFALGFQGFLIIICVGIYAVLVNEMVVADNLHSAIFSLAAYTVILCFSLFKSGALAKSIFNAH